MDWKNPVSTVVAILLLSLAARGACALEVAFLDVGEGESIYLESRGAVALVDTGNLLTGASVVRFLRENQVRNVNMLIVTHPHLDHLGGAFHILSNFAVEGRFDNGQNPTRDNDLYRWYRESFRTGSYRTLNTGQSIKLGDAHIEVLNAVEPDRKNLNRNSLVLRVTYGDTKLLLMGDADKTVEESLVKRSDLSAEILKVGHHGSNRATSPEFLSRVAPETAIISINRNNLRGYPAEETLALLREQGIETLLTFEEGTITFRSDGRRFRRVDSKPSQIR